MEKQKHSQQTWWQVVILVLVMIGLLILAHRVAPSTGWRIFLEIGVVVVSYGLITLWLNTHATVLLDREYAQYDSRAIELLDREMSTPPSSHVQVHFHVHSAPDLIYDMPEAPANRLGTNGHHQSKIIPPLPKETSNN